jgi:hypothetical protein
MTASISTDHFPAAFRNQIEAAWRPASRVGVLPAASPYTNWLSALLRQPTQTFYRNVNPLAVSEQASLLCAFGCSIATWIAIELMSRWYERAQSRGRSQLAA